MRNDFYRHKKNDKIKWVFTGIAFLLVFVFLAGLCMQLFGNDKLKPSNWFKKTECVHIDEDSDGKCDECGKEILIDSEEENDEVVEIFTTSKLLRSASAMRAVTASSENVRTVSYSITNTLTNGATLNNFKNVINSHSYDSFSYKITLRPSSSEFDTSTMGEVAYSRSFMWFGDGEGYVFYFGAKNHRLTYQHLDGFAEFGNYDGFGGEYTVDVCLDTYGYNNCLLELSFELTEEYLTFTFECHNDRGYTSSETETFTAASAQYKSLYNAIVSGKLETNFAGAIESIELYDNRPTVPLPPDPVKAGHTFIGWYYDSAFTRPYDNAPIFEDTDLYAKFEINKYTVTFDSNGGSAVASKTVNWNTAVALTTPTLNGFTFKGWYLPNGTQYTNQPVTDDIVLTARWEIIMCTVTFYVGGEVYTTKTVEYGTLLVDIVETASTMNLTVMSVRSAKGEISGAELATAAVTDDSLELLSEELTGMDKVINTVKNNKWQIIGGVAGGVALIAVIAAIADGTKRKRR